MDELLPFFPDLRIGLQQIASLDDEKFKELREAISGPEGLTVTAERCRNLANKLRSDARQIAALISSIEFLYRRSREWESQGRDTQIALHDFLSFADLEKHLGEAHALGYVRLGTLLVRNPGVERQRKIKWLQTGILDTAKSFASFVELRPNYSEDRSKIEEFVPVTIFRVVAESDVGEDREHIFQLTPEGLQKLRAAVDDVEKKLRNLYSDESVAKRIHVNLGEPKKE